MTSLVLSLLLFSSNVVSGLEKRDTSACTDVHLFLARGNGEAYPGRVGALANTVCDGLPSCGSDNIQFSSSQSYCDQASDGVGNGTEQIAAYSAACPDSKIVIGGYSLGAQIVGDIVGGGGGSFYSCTERSNAGFTPGIDPATNVAAILLFGDVRHVANQVYNTGPGSAANGQYPRSGTQLSNLNQFSSIMRSWCLLTDPICAEGDDGLSHETYMDVYASAAGDWVHSILAGGASATSSSSGAAATSTVVSTSTSEVAASTSTAASSSEEMSSSGASSTSAMASGSTTSAPVSTKSASSKEDVSSSSTDDSMTTSSSQASSSPTPFVFSTSATSVSVSVNSATFTPFVFSNTATALTTSTFTPSTFTPSIMNSTITRHAATATSGTMATSLSVAGAYSNSVQLTLNLITLVVIKVAAF